MPSSTEAVGYVARLISQLAPILPDPMHKPGNSRWLHGPDGRTPDAPLQRIESNVARAYGQVQQSGTRWRDLTAMEKAIVIVVEDGLKADQAVVVATTVELTPTDDTAEQFLDSLVRRVFGIEDARTRALLVRVLRELRRDE